MLQFQLQFVPDIPEVYSGYLFQLMSFMVGVAVTYLIGRGILIPVLKRTLRRRNVELTIRKSTAKVAHIAVIVAAVAVGMAFAGLGSFLTAATTLSAAMTLALGFAAQDVLSNFVAGVFIVSDPTFKIGDWIQWDDKEGIIEDISFRVTRVRTFNNEIITVPNSELTNTAVTNPVAKDSLRITYLFGIGYDDDIDKAREVLIEEAEAIDGILDDPAPSVRISDLADSYVGLQSRIWIDDPGSSDASAMKSKYLQAVKERCDEEDIEMPYPYRELTGGIDVNEMPNASTDSEEDNVKS